MSDMTQHLRQLLDAALYFSAGVGATRLWDATFGAQRRARQGTRRKG